MMCGECWQEYGAPRVDTPSVRRAAQLIASVYDEHPAGGGMHIVVDDFNIEDEHLEFCQSQVTTQSERDCLKALAALTIDERASALALHDGYFDA